jgi:hypothetical protein
MPNRFPEMKMREHTVFYSGGRGLNEDTRFRYVQPSIKAKVKQSR